MYIIRDQESRKQACGIKLESDYQAGMNGVVYIGYKPQGKRGRGWAGKVSDEEWREQESVQEGSVRIWAERAAYSRENKAENVRRNVTPRQIIDRHRSNTSLYVCGHLIQISEILQKKTQNQIHFLI